MEYFNFYYEDFLNEKLNLTDRVILSIISSFNEYTVNHQELRELIGITVSNIKLSIKKLKNLNLVQGEEILQLTNKVQGRYFKVEIEAGLDVKELLIKSYILHLPHKAYFGSLQTLSNVLYLSNPTVSKLLQTMVNNGKINKDKQGKVFKYSITDDSKKIEMIENVVKEEQQQTIPTVDVQLLNQRLNKASEVCKQLFTENETLNKIINQQQEQINQLKKSLTIYIDKFNKIDKVFQPILDCIDEQMRYIDTLYQETENKKNEFECKCDIKDIRNILARL